MRKKRQRRTDADDADPVHSLVRRCPVVRSRAFVSDDGVVVVSGSEHAVALFLLDDCPQLEALLAETRTLLAERLPSAAAASFAQFAERLDRHLRLQAHALFPRPLRQRLWAGLCATSRSLRTAVSEVEVAYDDHRVFSRTLGRVEMLFRRFIRQEARIVDPIALGRSPRSPRLRAAQRQHP